MLIKTYFIKALRASLWYNKLLRCMSLAIKKRRNKKIKSKNKRKPKINHEGLGIIFIIFGLISFISTFSDNMGLMGSVINKIYSTLAGSGNFLLALLLIFFGVVNNSAFYKRKNLYYFFSSLVVICVLIYLDGTKDTDMTLVARLRLSLEYGSITKSGGLVGALFGFFLYKIFGSVGTYLILLLLIIFSLFCMFKVNVGHLKNFLSNTSDKIKINVQKDDDKGEKSNIFSKLKNKFMENDSEDIDAYETPDFEMSKSNSYYESAYDKVEEIALGVEEDFSKDDMVNEKIEHIEKIEDEKKATSTKQEKAKSILSEESGDLEKDKAELEEEIQNQSTINKVEYVFPPVELLELQESSVGSDKSDMAKNAQIIKECMNNFGIECKIVAVNKGPSITCYELQPAPGVRLSKIVSLADNLSMALASPEIRIEAPIPGKSAVGIEVPNKKKDSVGLRELIDSKEFKISKTNLPLVLGKDVSGKIIVSSIDKMPHLLIAGATGSGKSVCINSIITSILYKSSPEDVKLMLIDPKVVELSVYNGIPHLLIPVVTDAKKAAFALNWAVEEMEKRYKAFAKTGTRDLKSYNSKIDKLNSEEQKLPQIVIVVDELADLMMVAASEVEDYIARLAQMARAAGIYLIIATQRPSVDVITGTIKANIPSRIAFAVSSSVDSRTILDMGGAEKLLGKGDMLFAPSYMSKAVRIQGAFISDDDVERIVEFVSANNQIVKEENKVMEKIELKNQEAGLDRDPLFNDAVAYVLDDEQASISYLQRKLKVGYSRAARIVDQMEEAGIIGPHEGSKPRKIIMDSDEIKNMIRDFEKYEE